MSYDIKLVGDPTAGLLPVAEVDRRVGAAIDRRLNYIFNRAKRVWPVGKGDKRNRDDAGNRIHSRDLLFFRAAGTTSDGRELVAALGNAAWYTGFIKRGYTMQDLLLKPFDLAVDRIVRDVGDELVR